MRRRAIQWGLLPQASAAGGSHSAPSSAPPPVLPGVNDRPVEAPDVPPQTPSEIYLQGRRRRVNDIVRVRSTTTQQVKRLVRISQIVSGLATVLALGAALAAALTPLSGPMLLLSFAVLLVAQLGHAYSHARTARLLRQSADRVRDQAFGCLELISLSPLAAVLDAQFPPAHGAGEPDTYPWYEVRAGLMAAASWRRAALGYEKKGKQTLMSLARAAVLQLLKGPIAWLTVLNSVVDLFKLMSKTKKLSVGHEVQDLGIEQVLRTEIDAMRQQEPRWTTTEQKKRLRDLFVLKCLLTLPNAEAIERRVDELQRAAGQNPDSLDRIIHDAESWALTQWQVFAEQHSDRALEQRDPPALDLTVSIGSIRPQVREQWVEDWLGEDRRARRFEATGEIQRFLEAYPAGARLT